MFRITSHFVNARNILYRRQLPELHIIRITREVSKFKYKSVQDRDPCQQLPPPPPPPPRDDRLFWGAMAIAFMAGSFAVYAKHTPEVRDWLTINAPWFDDFIAIAYEENMSYREFLEQCYSNLKDYLSQEKAKPCSLDGTPVPPVTNVPEEPKQLTCKEEDGEESPCDTLPPPSATKNICEIEFCLKDLGESSVNNYLTARDACIYYNKLVMEMLDNFTFDAMRQLHEAMKERVDLVKVSIDNAVTASKKLNDMTRYFECTIDAPKEAVEKTRAMLRNYQNKIKTISAEYLWENDKSFAFDKQWQMVETIILKYTEENQTLFPGLSYDKKPVFQGNADVLLYHTYRYVNQLRNELVEACPAMTDRINRAVETLPQGELERKARTVALQTLYKKKKANMEREFKQRADDQRTGNEMALKLALKRQLDRHNETVQLRVQQKEADMMSKFDKMVADKVRSEKVMFEGLLHEMSVKLQIVEDKLNAHLKAENETRRSQELYAAGVALLAATKKGDANVRVDKELRAIEQASGHGDKLVQTLLKAIPKSVREEGLVPESVLCERYHTMEAVALRVALIGQDGASLPVYFLSWLQSAVLFMKLSGIPQEEIDKPPKEPVKDLDTFDLLQRARYWIKRGNIAVALRYVSSLEGASRAAAASWYMAARSYVETRQAAEAVCAHAAALGLQYI